MKMNPVSTGAWSEAEELIVKNYYSRLGVDETLRQLKKIGSNKTRKQLISKASRMSIKVSSEIIKKNKSELRKSFLSKVDKKKLVMCALKSAETRRRQLLLLGKEQPKPKSDLYFRPKWDNPDAKMCYYLLDRHWKGEKFAPGTKEYEVLKRFNIIGY